MAIPELVNYIKYPKVNAEYFKASYREKVIKSDTAFSFEVTVNGQSKVLSLSLPESGGFRFYSNEKGYFDTQKYCKLAFSEENGDLKISANELLAVFRTTEKDWELTLFDSFEKKFVFSSKNLLFGFKKEKPCSVKLTLKKQKDELFYGLGERFNGLFQEDEILLWNTDGYYTGNKTIPRTLSYINVPLFHSTSGYSLFYNSSYCAVADFDGKSKNASVTSFGNICDFFIWTKSPVSNIMSYTDLTGKPFVPPKWAFNYWAGGGAIVWEMNGLSIIPEILKGWVTEYEEMKAPPCAVFGEGRPSFDKKNYDYLNEHGIKMLMWNYSGEGIETVKKLLPESNEAELPIIRYCDNPEVYYENYIDYTHPDAVKFISEKYKEYWDWGLKGIMVDFGEYVDANTVMANGKTGNEMHNLHALFYNKANFEAWNTRMNGDFVLFARAGCAGSQAYAANFTGDQASDWEGLKEQVNAVISASASGFSIIGGDIGGFFTQPRFDLYCRWLQFATFTPLMRAHGCPTGRNPWEWGDNGRNIFKAHYFLRKNLLKYIYDAALKSGKTGEPMVKPFVMAFSENKDVWKAESQYMFCDGIMVAPVTEMGAEEWDVTFPVGNWYNIWTGEKISGENRKVTVKVPYDRGPVYFKSGFVTEISVGDELRLGTEVTDATAKDALLITPPDMVASYNDYFISPFSKGFEMVCGKHSDIQYILLHGGLIKTVAADGNELSESEDFYNDADNRAVIKLKSKWKKITVVYK